MSSAQPKYRAYTIVKREGQDDFWLPIGAAFAHQSGDGLNVILQALPIDGKIVLRPPKGDDKPDDERGEGAGNVQPLRSENNKSGSRRR